MILWRQHSKKLLYKRYWIKLVCNYIITVVCILVCMYLIKYLIEIYSITGQKSYDSVASTFKESVYKK